MQDQTEIIDDDISLAELSAALWAHKLLIILVTGLSIFLSGYYAINAEKVYKSTAVFEIEESRSGGLNIPGDLGAIAAIAGFGTVNSSGTDILLERIMGREFILKATRVLSLDKDPFFNTYDPDRIDPLWKALLKKLIGWEKNPKTSGQL